jgi:hypothetical protein
MSPETSASIRELFAQYLEGKHATLTPPRLEILSFLTQALRPAPGVCALFGLPGVGKSTLARAIARQWPGPSTWIRALDLTLPDLLAYLCDAFTNAQLRPRDHAARIRLLHHVMRRQRSEGPRLLVLDQAELLCPDEAQQLLSLLAQPAIPDTPGLHILLVAQGAIWLDWLPSTLALIHAHSCLNPLTHEEAALILNSAPNPVADAHDNPAADPPFPTPTVANLNAQAEGRPGQLLRLALQSLQTTPPTLDFSTTTPFLQPDAPHRTIPISTPRARAG